MGQVYLRRAKIYLYTASLLFLVAFPALAKRDPRQISWFVSDIDGTITKNVGHFVLRRVGQMESVTPFFHGMHLPETVRVPVYDYEGNLGPQIAKRIGRLDEKGRFIASTSLDPITLSNGETIIPGYYYFDPQLSFQEFYPNPHGESFFVSAIKEKIENKEQFLLEGYALFAASMHARFADRTVHSLLTKRAHEFEEYTPGFEMLSAATGLPWRKLPPEAYASLSHPDFFEFSGVKSNYLQRGNYELSDRPMTDMSTPHYLVMIENDRKHLRDIDTLFKRLGNRGLFKSPVVPILVNVVEDEVLQAPDGHDWDRSPMHEVSKMSRVTIYRPGRVERSNDISKVLELTLDISAEEAKKLLADARKTPFFCKNLLLAGAK